MPLLAASFTLAATLHEATHVLLIDSEACAGYVSPSNRGDMRGQGFEEAVGVDF